MPDLAEAAPEISEDGKTVTVKIRPGIKFSPPVDREVTSADVKYAIERGFFNTLNNGYAGAYFGDLEGAKVGAKPGTEIPGIETPDDQTIVFNLTKGTGGIVAGALALPLSAPVPKEYAEKFDKQNPSAYGQNQVATGPYMIENDASGKAIGYEAGRRIHLVRNPNWVADGDYRPAYVDEIDMPQGNDDTTVASRKILDGENMINGDFRPGPGDPQAGRLERGDEGAARRCCRAAAAAGSSMNTTIKPFDNLNVRRAVVAGFDREAMRLTRGGELIGDIPTHYIPPEVPGFDEAGGLEGPGIDFMSEPGGRPGAVGRVLQEGGLRLRQVRGRRGDPDGRHLRGRRPEGGRGRRRRTSRSWASRSTSGSSRRTRCTRSSATRLRPMS